MSRSRNTTDAPGRESAVAIEVAARLRLAVARTARRLRQEAGSADGAGELTPTTAAALSTVERCGPLTPSELADIERIKRPTATRIIGRLEAGGMIERTPDPEDGRSFLVAATPAARERLRSMRRRKNAYLARGMRGLSAAEVETLARAATILEGMLDGEREES